MKEMAQHGSKHCRMSDAFLSTLSQTALDSDYCRGQKEKCTNIIFYEDDLI